MDRIAVRVVWLWAALAVTGTAAENKLNETRTTLEKWVETRQLIARTSADWQADKEMLTQTRQLFERELQSIQEQRSKISTNSTQVETERAQAEETLGAAKATLDLTRQQAGQFEARILELVPRLPAPLQDILKPLLHRIPSDGGQTKMSAAERVQVIVGILNELDKFNSGVNIFHEKRQNANGEEVAVESIYVGLGAAYFVNSTGELAGTGAPGAKGWEWTLQPDLGPALQEIVRIYRNERSARFVALPVVIR
jgi:hypothetical protein